MSNEIESVITGHRHKLSVLSDEVKSAGKISKPPVIRNLMKLDELFGTNEAAGILGVSVPTLRNYIKAGKIQPIGVGDRSPDSEKSRPHGYVYTARMLSRFKDGRLPAKPTKHEIEQIFNLADAAEYLDITANAVKQAHFVRKTLPGKRVGGDTVFLLRDLIMYQNREPIGGSDHPRALFTEAQVNKMRQLYSSGVKITAIMERMSLDCDLSTVYGVVTGRTYKNVKQTLPQTAEG